MALLASAQYDPAVAVSKATSALIAMTAIDTTNLRVTFTVPANGTVLVRMQCNITGATTFPRILLGVLEGATVRGRQSPIGGINPAALATDLVGQEAVFIVKGLTPGASVTWDAAYCVEIVLAATNIKYGGPNDTTGADAWGAFCFEVYDTVNLLAGTMYDPAAAATKSGAALLAMTAIDTTNLRLTFTVPPSGKVFWQLRVPWTRAGANWGQILLGVMEGATIRGRVAPTRGVPQTNVLTSVMQSDASGTVAGLTSGASLTWDAAYAVQVISSNATGTLKYGGPDNTTTDDAWGGALFLLWNPF